MPKAYIVVNAARRDVIPASEYFSAESLARFREMLAAHNGRVLVGTEEIDRRVGGSSLGRLIIIEFADKATAVSATEAYMRGWMPLRPGGTLDLVIVEGMA